jgi:hypothetical protein
MRLAGPAIDATAGITLGESAVDEHGALTPARPERSHIPAAREITVDVPAASAALVSMHT